MNECADYGIIGEAVIYPPRQKPAQHASEPRKPTVSIPVQAFASQPPSLANIVQMQTFDNNLQLKFGFRDVPTTDIGNLALLANVVVSSKTAKQLFLDLADLFQCEIQPRNKS